MYFGSPLFNGGSVAPGVQAPSTIWYHAEGATGPYFDTYLLLANPGTVDAIATVTYLLPAGAPVTRTYQVAAKQRVIRQRRANEDPRARRYAPSA